MFSRVIAAATCALSPAGCQQAGPALSSTAGVTAPTAPSIKAIDVPFSGGVTGEAFFDFVTNPKASAAGFTTITTAHGVASHMGLTTWRSRHCPGPDGTLVNTELVLTAANGDELHATYTGACDALLPEIGGTFDCSGHAVFSGGTGRFASANGSAHWSATVTFEGFEDFSWAGRWEWKGTIRY